MLAQHVRALAAPGANVNLLLSFLLQKHQTLMMHTCKQTLPRSPAPPLRSSADSSTSTLAPSIT